MRKLITIRTILGDRQVSADIVGHMAVHANFTDAGLRDHEWRITHLPSGIGFTQYFPTREAAIAAATEIGGLRDDWATFDNLCQPDPDFLAALAAVYRKHDARKPLPDKTGDRRIKFGRMGHPNDLNGYGG